MSYINNINDVSVKRNKYLNLGFVTIGNGDWKKIIKSLWESLEIEETGYKLDRCYQEYFSKLEIDNCNLPCDLTNNPMHLTNNYILKLLISMPVNDKYKDNQALILLPWYDEEIPYSIASKICSERVVWEKYCDHIIMLCGEDLTKEEKNFRNRISQICVDQSKLIWEIGNDFEGMKIQKVIDWIKSGENYCAYFPHTCDIERAEI